MIATPYTIKLHNWRKFDTCTITIPRIPVCIVDQNGSGKTSVIAAIHALETGRPWPGLAFKQSLKFKSEYFGITLDDDLHLGGSVSASGRLVTKYTNEKEHRTPIMTYIPNDNLWLFLSRTQKLQILDTLLMQSIGNEYTSLLEDLNKTVKQKTALLKRFLEDGRDDRTLAIQYGNQIHTLSVRIWGFRDRYFRYLIDNITDYYSWIDANHDFDLKVQRSVDTRRSYIEIASGPKDSDQPGIWEQEKRRGRLLYGAQRDDFDFLIGFNSVTNILSRGEMRLLVLFMKYQAVLMNRRLDSALWLLDDVFNEFDQKRESILFESVLSKSGSFIATSTKNPSPNVSIVTMKDIIDNH